MKSTLIPRTSGQETRSNQSRKIANDKIGHVIIANVKDTAVHPTVVNMKDKAGHISTSSVRQNSGRNPANLQVAFFAIRVNLWENMVRITGHFGKNGAKDTDKPRDMSYAVTEDTRNQGEFRGNYGMGKDDVQVSVGENTRNQGELRENTSSLWTRTPRWTTRSAQIWARRAR